MLVSNCFDRETEVVDRWRVTGGTRVFFGAPKIPMPAEREASLREVIRLAPDVAFAYIPLFYIEGKIDPPKQVLYLVLRDSARAHVEDVMKSLGALIHAHWPKGEFIDMLPAFSDHPWLNDVIRTGCFLAANDEELHRRCAERAKSSAPVARQPPDAHPESE